MSVLPLSVRIPRRSRVLLVDDDRLLLGSLVRLLGRVEPNWELRVASSGKDALECLKRESIDVVVTDLHMPGMDGFGLLVELERSHRGTIRVVHSSHPDTLHVARSRHLAHSVVQKPAACSELIEALRSAVRAASEERRALGS